MPTLSLPAVRYMKVLTLAMYVAGAIGLSIESSRPLFQLLTPFNLLFTALLLLVYQAERTPAFWGWVLLAAGLGYLAEVIGVATGFPFGSYVYGSTLGVKVWEVPLTIALNWLVLAYGAGYVVYRYIKVPWWGQAFLAAVLMVALDVAIEPVAIAYDFWSWELGQPPLQNYLGWFGVALVIQGGYFRFSFPKANPIALHLWALQAIFFLLCLLLFKII